MASKQTLIWLSLASFLGCVVAEAGVQTFTARRYSGHFVGDANEIANFDPHDYVPSHYGKVRVAHGVLMSVVWLIIFPLGAILPRLWDRYSSWAQIHVTMQLTGLCIVLAAAGMGIWMAKQIDQLSAYHPILGMFLLLTLVVQPVTELLNHCLYQKWPRIIITGHIHLGLGRALLIVGAIQGGLGFLFSSTFKNNQSDVAPRAAYGATALTIWIFYISVGIIYPEFRSPGRQLVSDRESQKGESTNTETSEATGNQTFPPPSKSTTHGSLAMARLVKPSTPVSPMPQPYNSYFNSKSPPPGSIAYAAMHGQR